MKKPILLLIVLCLTIILQAQTSKIITNLTAGDLKSELTSIELSTVTSLTVSGTMDARDFKTIKDNMPALAELELTNVLIAEYTGTEGTIKNEYKTYPANTIPDGALYGNTSITILSLPASITRIDNSAFAYCSKLASVNIPASLISIGDNAFQHCSLLTSITIPTTLVSIGRYAFVDCMNLESINIPASVTTIGIVAFSICTANITVDPKNTFYSSIEGVLFNKDQTELIQCPVSKAGDYTIPSSVKTIKEQAFSFCSLLTSITIPNTVTAIGTYAFYHCTGLTTVSISNSVSSLEENIFGACTSLTSVTIPNSVTIIRSDSFSGCTALTSVTIPNSVTTIENRAFVRCSALTTIVIPNSVTTIGGAVFVDCTALKSVTLSNSVNTIAAASFSNCTGLTSITIPNSVKTIETNAFSDCTGLISVNISNSVTTIGRDVFNGCTSLTTVTIPNSVTTIGDRAFRNCRGLTSVTIPASVTSMGEYVFLSCDQLASIIANSSSPIVLPSSSVFYGVNKNTCVLYVPAGSIDKYNTADIWKDFIKTAVITSTQKEIKNQAITVSPNPAKEMITIHADEGLVSIYNSNGKLVVSHLLKQSKQVNISSLKPGMYVAVVNGESFKIIKE